VSSMLAQLNLRDDMRQFTVGSELDDFYVLVLNLDNQGFNPTYEQSHRVIDLSQADSPAPVDKTVSDAHTFIAYVVNGPPSPTNSLTRQHYRSPKQLSSESK
jgi:hypothetical protein